MANGDGLNLEKIWEDVPVNEDVKIKAIKDSFIAVGTAWEHLPCKERAGELRALRKFMYVLMGIGIVISVALIPLLIEFLPKLFK